jgi:hypothetical protein
MNMVVYNRGSTGMSGLEQGLKVALTSCFRQRLAGPYLLLFFPSKESRPQLGLWIVGKSMTIAGKISGMVDTKGEAL